MNNNFIIISSALAIVNLIAFILVGLDKKRSTQHSERVPEVYLFFIAVLFASLGVLFGMYYFRHKTRKIYFPLGMGILLIQQIILILFFTNKIK